MTECLKLVDVIYIKQSVPLGCRNITNYTTFNMPNLNANACSLARPAHQILNK